MSPSDANPVKGSSSPPNATYAAVLTWDVFVTPGIPIVTADRPPDVRETYFQATTKLSETNRETLETQFAAE